MQEIDAIQYTFYPFKLKAVLGKKKRTQTERISFNLPETLENLLGLLNEVDFTFADIHRYSPRSKTKAATMPEQIPQEVIEDRYARLLLAFSKHLRETRPDR